MNGFHLAVPGVNVAVIRRTPAIEFLILTRAAGETYSGRRGILGGSREGDESIVQLGCRELSEETGLIPINLWLTEYLTTFFDLQTETICHYPVLVAEVSADATIRLNSENCAFGWHAGSEARTLVSWRNLRELLAKLEEDAAEFPPPNWVQLLSNS